MPLYEYECTDHGVFESHRAMNDYALAGTCPTCGRVAPRIVSLSRGACVDRPERVARDRNERSRNEPSLVSRPVTSGLPRAMRAPQHGRPWALGH
ncbi:MAG: zinc ribbon domain-containing protein [Polyangiaceae bacterium]